MVKTNRITKSHSLQNLDILGHSRTHEERLVDLRKVAAREDLLNVVRVTVGKDKIGFIDGEGFEAGEGECL